MVEVATEVCVVGGGMAGVCAALAAARHGARVALVQDRPVLGGNASSETRMHVCGADYGDRLIWRETGILEELRLEALAWNDEHNPTRHDLALYDAVRRERNIALFLNATMLEAQARDRRVVSCTAHELTSGRRLRFIASHFVDASGDGVLAHAVGASYRHGREGRGEYGESLAPEQADGLTMGHSLLFQVRDVGRPVPFIPPPWALVFESDDDLPHRSHLSTFGYWWVEWGGTLDTISDTEAIREELLAAALGVWDHMKNRGDHGFANHALEWLGFLPAKRESRRFLGDHVLTQGDLQAGRHFPDDIAYGGWTIDVHPPEGFRSPQPPAHQVPVPGPYGIPLRACYSRDFDNLFLAGRNISASRVAFASTRVMATCALVGQGVGTAAALAAARGLTTRETANHHVGKVQQQLLADGVWLPGLINEDTRDLARGASVACSSEAAGFPAINLIDGVSHPEPGHPHCWRSDPEAGLPAWAELRWPEPVSLDLVQVVCDTDFGSRLTLTQSESHRKSCGPVPRAVTARTLAIQAQCARGEWATVARVAGNFQRLVRVALPAPVVAPALRVVVEDTWGAPGASLFEVRVYG